jgi:uncharacterized protein YcaQ
MIESLSPKQAKKIILLSHSMKQENQGKTARDVTLAAINQLGYVQIDTISRVVRAHHHTLWNRVGQYQPAHLDQLQKQRQIFEYWSHAAAYLPIADYRYCRVKMQQMTDHEKPWN